NTAAGIRYARALYVDGIQLDVRLSADDELVAIHDETVDRTTRSRGRVSSMKAEKLASLDARADFPSWPEASGVPTLADALDAASGIPHLALSVQPDEPKRLRRLCERLVALLEHRWILDRVSVLSTSEGALREIERLAPFVPRVRAGWFDMEFNLDDARRLRCRGIAVPLVTCSPTLIEAARDRELQVMGWLGNTAAEVQAFSDLGVDAIITDFPTIAKRALGRH
ncbi:MAG: glycerophosphodiester phosphodiesterase, partial [Chloroflexota bacterium]